MRDAITIRNSTSGDRTAIVRLAELDSRAAPAGDSLLAIADGKLLAAVGIADGKAVADPFELTAEVVDLLQVRADQERAGRRPGRFAGRRWRRLAGWQAKEVRA